MFHRGVGEAHVTAFGLACMFIAEISEAFRSVGVQYLIANKRFSLFNGMYYFSPATLVFLMALSAAFEARTLSPWQRRRRTRILVLIRHLRHVRLRRQLRLSRRRQTRRFTHGENDESAQKRRRHRRRHVHLATRSVRSR